MVFEAPPIYFSFPNNYFIFFNIYFSSNYILKASSTLLILFEFFI